MYFGNIFVSRSLVKHINCSLTNGSTLQAGKDKSRVSEIEAGVDSCAFFTNGPFQVK